MLADLFRPYFNILFAHDEHYASFVGHAGFGTFECKSLPADDVLEKVRGFDFSWLNTRDLEEVFLDQVKAIEKYEPAIVLGDASPTLAMAAEKTGTQFISLFNGYMSKYYKGERTLPHDHPLYAMMKRFPAFISSKMQALGERVTFGEIHKPFEKIRRKYQIKRKRSYLDELEGDYNIICDIPDLFPQQPLPPNYTMLSPLLYKNFPSSADFTHALDKTKKTIFICMGSTGNWQALAHLNDSRFDQYNIIAAGDTTNQLPAAHIIKTGFVDAETVLPLADLVICHGGNGTIYHVLSYGVPLLCVPNHFEHEWNAVALEKNGAAKILHEIDTPQELLGCIKEVIESKPLPVFQDLARKIKSAVDSADQKIFELVTYIRQKE